MALVNLSEKSEFFSLFLDKLTKVIRRVGVYFQTHDKSVDNQSCFPCYNDHWVKIFANKIVILDGMNLILE